MAEYNGHPSWNAWNVSLWIGNDEGLYLAAVEALKRTTSLDAATARFFRDTGLRDTKTADGGRYTARSVRHALAGLEIEQPKKVRT